MTNEIARGLIDLAKWVVMAIAIIFTMLTIRSCSNQGPKTSGEVRPGKATVETVVVHDTIPGDPVPYLVQGYAPGRDSIIYLPVPTAIDKDSVAREHFAKVFSSDTIRKEGSALIIINDSVSQNMIYWRNVLLQNTRPTAINTTITPVQQGNRRSLLVGAFISGRPGDIGAGPALLYLARNQNALGYSYDLLRNQHLVTGYIKLRIQK